MSAFLEGIGKIFGKVADQVQGRIERLKNEREGLLNERKKLMDGDVNAKSMSRVVAIDNRLQQIETILANKATD
jgi:hypothetical protein